MRAEVPVLTGLAVLVFILIHLQIGKLRFLDGVPRSRWLSFAGGVAVAYVFLHVLPELSVHQQTVGRASEGRFFWRESEIYLVAVAGLAAFYGVERRMRGSRARMAAAGEGDRPERSVFWLHIASFAAYNALIGYLLLDREQPGLRSLLLYAVAMALHFVTNDYGLRQDYKDGYERHARWVLAASVLIGWLLGFYMKVSGIALALLFAFLSGGVILNVLKEELPEERQSRFLPFAGGLIAYGALLLLTR